MRTLAGCRSCGHVEMAQIEAVAGVDVGGCPRCGSRMRSVGVLGAHLLRQGARDPIPEARVEPASMKPTERGLA